MVGSCGMHPYTPSAHHFFLTSQFSTFLDISSLVLWHFPIFPAAVTSRHTRVSARTPQLPVPGRSHQTPSWCWTRSRCSLWIPGPVFPPWYPHHGIPTMVFSTTSFPTAPPQRSQICRILHRYHFLFDSRNGLFVSAPSPPAPKFPRNPTLDFGSFVLNPNLSQLRFPAPPTWGKRGINGNGGF